MDKSRISYPDDVGDGWDDLPRGAFREVLQHITVVETAVDEVSLSSFTPPDVAYSGE